MQFENHSRDTSFAANAKTDYGSNARIASFNGVLDQLNSSANPLNQSAGLEPAVKNSLCGVSNEYNMKLRPVNTGGDTQPTRAHSGEKPREKSSYGLAPNSRSSNMLTTVKLTDSRNGQALPASGATTQSLLAKQFGASGSRSVER